MIFIWKYMADQVSCWSASLYLQRACLQVYHSTGQTWRVRDSILQAFLTQLWDQVWWNYFFHIQIPRTCWVSYNFLGFMWTWIWKISISKDHRSAHIYHRFWKFKTSFWITWLKEGRQTVLKRMVQHSSQSVVTAEAMFGLEMTQPFNKHTWAHYHIQKGNSEQKRHATEFYFKGEKKKTKQQPEDRPDL